jgi:hypothetical protein
MEKLCASLIAALSVILIYLSLKEMTSPKVALISALIFAFGTNTWATSSQALWQHGMAELLLAAMVYLVLIGERRGSSPRYIVCMGILLGLFIFNRPPDALLLVPMLFYVISLGRIRTAWFFCSMLASGAPFFLYNQLYLGTIFGGYGSLLSTFSLGPRTAAALLGLLISPSRGILIYTPVVILSILGYLRIGEVKEERLRYFLLLSGASVAAQVFLYSGFGMWWAGQSYGPRFLTGTLPLLALLMGISLKEVDLAPFGWKKTACLALIAMLLLWSIFVQIVGVFCYPNGDWDAYPENVDFHPQRLWDWKDSQIARSWTAGPIVISPVNVFKIILEKQGERGRYVSLRNFTMPG